MQYVPRDGSRYVFVVVLQQRVKIELSEKLRQPLVRGFSTGEQRDGLGHWRVQRHLVTTVRIGVYEYQQVDLSPRGRHDGSEGTKHRLFLLMDIMLE